MKISKIITIMLSAVFILACAVLLASCTGEGSGETEINSVKIKGGDKIVITASLSEEYISDDPKGTVYVMMLSTCDPASPLSNAEKVAQTAAKSSMTFKIPLYSDSGSSRISCAFVLAKETEEGYQAITEPYYISDPGITAKTEKSGNLPSGIKGLSVEDVYGAKLLGADQMLIEARMEKLILSDHSEDAVKYNFEGISYFYSGEELEKLDRAINDADKLGMCIYIRTVLLYDKDNDTVPEFLYCKGAKGAESYMPDVSNENAVRYLRAFYSFLASRYPVCRFIIGDRVNSYRTYCNAGTLSSEEFERSYSFWTRLAYQTLASENSAAEIYIPIDNTWRTDGQSGVVGAASFLSHFADIAEKSGDYEYGIAVNLGEGDDLPMLLSGEGYDYTKICVTNLSDLVSFLNNAEMKYSDERRKLIIDGLELSNDISEKNRAAYYTMAYYTAAQNKFDAFICSSDLYADEEMTRSDFYYSILMCGSDKHSQLNAYTDKLKDVSVPSFGEYISSKLIYKQSVLHELPDQVLKNKRELPLSLDSFECGGGINKFQGRLDGNGEHSWLLEADTSRLSGAVSSFSVEADDIIGAGYIGMRLSSDTAPTVALMIFNEAEDKDACIYICEDKLANGESMYYFDITELAKKVKSSDKLTVAICIIPTGSSEESLEIHEIALFGSSGGGSETVVAVTVVVTIAAALIALIVFLSLRRKNKRRKYIEE